MELTEAVRRILHHWVLILFVMAAIGWIPVLLDNNRDNVYEASARISMGSDTTTSEQAEALVDATLGVVTSQGNLESAIETLDVDRDAEELADSVDVASVGISGVLVVSVEDRNPAVARDLANLLSERFVTFRTDRFVAPLQERLTELDTEFEAFSAEIVELEDSVQGDIAFLTTLQQSRLEELVDLRRDVRSQQQEIITALAAAPSPSVIDPARAPVDPAPSRLIPDLAIAILLGLVLGVAAAAAIEALRPTIVGRDALARYLSVPLLGRVSVPEDITTDAHVVQRLHLAASRRQVQAVHLMKVDVSAGLHDLGLVKALETSLPSLEIHVFGEGELTGLAGSSAASDSLPPNWAHDPQAGLVVVAPDVFNRGDLAELEHLSMITEWPLLGVMAYKPQRWWQRWWERASAESKADKLVPVSTEAREDAPDTTDQDESEEQPHSATGS